MKSFIKTLCLIGSASAAAGAWDYKTNGADWGKVDVKDNLCGVGLN